MTLPRVSRTAAEHSLFVVYFFWLIWLQLSSMYFARSAKEELTFTAPLLLFAVTFGLAYLFSTTALPRLLSHEQSYALPDRWVRALLVGLLVLFASIAVMHLVTLGHIPAILAHQTNDGYEIAKIRANGYFSLEVWQRYASDYAIKGIGPTLLVLAARFKSWVFVPALVVGLCYTVALFVKVNPVYLLLPLIFYFFLCRRFVAAIAVLILMATSVAINWTASTPQLRSESQATEDVVNEIKAPNRHINRPEQTSLNQAGLGWLLSIRERFVIVPAQVTAQWYFEYADPGSQEGGCGYRFMAKLLGCPYVHIPTKLYRIYYADLVRERGLTGSLNAGAYMHDFANFGYKGVIVGALFFGVLFCLIRFLCGTDPAFLALNLMPALSLAEMPLSTVLNSGGWLMIIGTCAVLRFGGRWLKMINLGKRVHV